jgi:hypothetical protein
MCIHVSLSHELTLDPHALLLSANGPTELNDHIFKCLLGALSTRFGCNASDVRMLKTLVSRSVPTWNRIRRVDGGDLVQATGLGQSHQVQGKREYRDNSFVKVSLLTFLT